jgi:23S rRNA (cytidine1920-2'-O)/16S rRNA (cytidine1409-2'-O)-methyltransferase
MRADQLLVERGLAASRSQACVRLIAERGLRWRDAGTSARWWRSVVKNKDDVPESAELELADAAEARYVSRGGLKLEGALRHRARRRGQAVPRRGPVHRRLHRLPAAARRAKVVGVDVGHGQLHARLREDERVVAIEGVNARALSADDLREDSDEAGDEVDEHGECRISATFSPASTSSWATCRSSR